MSDNARFLDAFPTWLKTLGEDVSSLSQVLADDAEPEAVRRLVAGAANYLFKSLDLIPDGIEDLGYLDDAFVMRVAAGLASTAGSASPHVAKLAQEAVLIREFLGADYGRLEKYVQNLGKGAARGRTVDDILGKPDVRSAFVSEVAGWAGGYQAPSFSRDDKTLVKMKKFLDERLPR